MNNKYLLKIYLTLKYLPYLMFVKRPSILSFEETIDTIINYKKSFTRFGDGEIRMVLNVNEQIGFQNKNHALSKRLSEVLMSKNKYLLVGLPNSFGLNGNYVLDSQLFWLGFNFSYSIYFFKKIDLKRIYGDSLVTRFYMPFKNKSGVTKKVLKFKEIWQDQDVLIVEGKDTKLGVGNDLFENSKSINRILCPSKNAFDKYDEILEKVQEHGKDKLILIALGPTATVLAHDLALSDFWAIDIGHIDIEFMWYKLKYTKKQQIEGKAVNEVQSNKEASKIIIEDRNYLNSILFKIE